MKDKEIIEEMAEIIYKTDCAGEACEYVSSCIEKGIPFSRINTQLFIITKQAERLYEQGYRKLPEDSVVLSTGEYKRLLDNAIRVDMEYLDHERAKERKKTTEKILNEIYKVLWDEKTPIANSFVNLDVKIREIATREGVEIKE